jgi:hypothetical protein
VRERRLPRRLSWRLCRLRPRSDPLLPEDESESLPLELDGLDELDGLLRRRLEPFSISSRMNVAISAFMALISSRDGWLLSLGPGMAAWPPPS